jgi:Tfp pilus assembly protein PilO
MASKLDKKQSIMMGIIVAIALSVGFYMLYYDPSQKKMVEIRKDIEAKENEIKNAKIQVAIFKPLKEQVAKLEKQLDNLRAKTATSGEIISLIKTIEDEAKRLDLKVINMFSTVHEPPPPTEKSGTGEESGKSGTGEESPEAQTSAFTKVVLDISLQGEYDKLEDFMETIQHQETFLVVEGLDISGAEKIYPRLTSNMEINLYNEKGVDNNAIIQ